MNPKLHPSINAFLKENPDLLVPPKPENRTPGYVYPDLERWCDYSLVLTEGDLWGNDFLMTRIAAYFVGNKAAVLFPTFYMQRWPKIMAKNMLIDIIDKESDVD